MNGMGGGMARRRRTTASPVGLVLVIASVFLIYKHGWVALVLLWLFVILLWAAFFKKTQCDVEKENGQGCGNPARGRLRACHLTKHKRAKHDDLWAMLRLQNPASRYRIMWAQPRSGYGRKSPQLEGPPLRLMHPKYDACMLGATVLGAIAAAAALGVQIISLR